MSNIKCVVALGAVAARVGLAGCSGGGGTNACLAAALGSDCFSCLQASCGPEVSDLESACSDYLSCICSGGNLSCSANASSACNEKANEPACTSAALPFGTCSDKNCSTACNGAGAACGSSSTTCSASASLDGGCTNGQQVESCANTTGGTTSCYYKVGSQQFDCSSCTDTTSCAEAANAACH